jgi:hypothetical protein
MTRPVQHEIEDDGEAIFFTHLPKNCGRSPLKSDYGKDYLCEMFKDGQRSGVEFYVQLKGSSKNGKGKRRKAYLAYPMDVEKLVACLTKWQMPAFLVVADTDQKIAYYCFLQQYIQEHLEGTNWESKTEISIKILYGNVLSNHSKFLTDCENATAFFVSHKLRLEERRLEAKDPRFQVTLTASSSERNYVCKTKKDSDVTLTLKFKESDTLERLQHGYSVNVNAENCIITGSPLFEIKQDAVVRIAADDEVSVTLIARDKITKRELVAIPAIAGTRTRSQKRIAFKSKRDKAFWFELEATNTVGAFKMGIDFQNWREKYLTRLEGFDDIYKLVNAIVDDAILSVEGIYETEAVIGPVEEKGQFYNFQWFLTVLKMGRALAQLFNVQPKLPTLCTSDQLKDVHRLYRIVSEKKIEEISNGSISVTLGTFNNVESKCIGPLAVVFENFKFPLFDAEVVLTSSRHTFENTKLLHHEKLANGHYLIKFKFLKDTLSSIESLDSRKLPDDSPLFARPTRA